MFSMTICKTRIFHDYTRAIKRYKHNLCPLIAHPRRWRGLFYRLACGKYSTTGNNHCRLIAILIVPNRIFANTARTKTTHAIGSRLVDDDLVYTVIEERASISIAALPVTCAVALNLQFLNSTACPLILPSFSASIVHTLYV